MQTRKIDIGTRVIVKQQKRNKLTPTFMQYPNVVINVTAKAPRARIAIQGEEGEHRLSQVPQQTTQQPRET